MQNHGINFMKVGIYSAGSLWGSLQVSEGKIQIEGDQDLYNFIANLYNSKNQSPQEFVDSLPSRLHGRVYAAVIAK